MKITSNTIFIVAFSGGLKCPRKIHFNLQCPTPYLLDFIINRSKAYFIEWHFINSTCPPPPPQILKPSYGANAGLALRKDTLAFLLNFL